MVLHYLYVLTTKAIIIDLRCDSDTSKKTSATVCVCAFRTCEIANPIK